MAYHLALVTGATSGIGKEICNLFAQKGIDLVVTGRKQGELQLLKDKLSGQVNVRTLQADLAQPQDRQRLIRAMHEWGPDLVVNNAGFGLYGESLTYSTNEQLEILEVNGQAVLELTLEAARTLRSLEKKGVILNVSSAAGFQVFPEMAVYTASKAFVNNFSQAFDFELKQYGIRILTICPGMVATNFQKRAGGTKTDYSGTMTASFVAEQVWKQIEQLDPLRIVDWKYRLLTAISYLIPKNWIAAVQRQVIRQRMNPRTFIKIEK